VKTCANVRLWVGVVLLMGLPAMSGAEDESVETGPPSFAEEATALSAEATEAVAEPGSSDALVSVDFKDADIRQVLRVISLKSGVDIVAGNDVEGTVTIKLTNVPWEEALDIILRTYGFTYERKGRIVRVMTVQALEQEALDTEVFPLNYAKAKDVSDVIKEMRSDRGQIKYDERTNTVIVSDIPTTLFQIKEVISRLDQRTPQVLIETRIVETKLEKDEHLGIRWSDSFTLTQTQTSFPSSFPFKAQGTLGELGDTFVSSPLSRVNGPSGLLDANPTTTLGEIGIGTLSSSALAWTLNALKQRSDTKVVSNPTLTVLNNQEASILIGEEFPIPEFSVNPDTGNTTISSFKPKKVGTVLTVTPHVNPSREVVLDLQPEVIAVTANATFNVSGSTSVSLPRFTTQTVKTQVRVLNGETVAIGGLVKTTELVQVNKVPLLGDIPIIGLLFTNKRKFGGSSNPTLQQDLLIFLTVKLLEDDRPQGTAVVSQATP
jgi:type IV pilus assembly protein PilQ